MKLNFINNYKTIYYNLNVNFYLVLNLILPIFNDVIINLQSEATKLLMNDLKTLKKIKINDFINELSECKKLLLNSDQNIYIIQYNDIQNKELDHHFICEDTGEEDTGEDDTGEEDTGEEDTGEEDTGDFEIKEFILKKLD